MAQILDAIFVENEDGSPVQIGKTQCPAPTDNTDIANKYYVDNHGGGTPTITPITLHFTGGVSAVDVAASLAVTGKLHVLSIPAIAFAGNNDILTSDAHTLINPPFDMTFNSMVIDNHMVATQADFNFLVNNTILFRHFFTIFGVGSSFTSSACSFTWIST